MLVSLEQHRKDMACITDGVLESAHRTFPLVYEALVASSRGGSREGGEGTFCTRSFVSSKLVSHNNNNNDFIETRLQGTIGN